MDDMKKRGTILNPIAPPAAGAVALGLAAGFGWLTAAAGPFGDWLGLAAPARSAAAEGVPTTTAAVDVVPPAADDSFALRGRLAAAERRVAELEAEGARSRDEAARLRAELQEARDQVAWLSQEIETSWRWIEELNAVLAEVRTGADPRPATSAGPPVAAAAPEVAGPPPDRGGGGGEADAGLTARIARAIEAFTAVPPPAPATAAERPPAGGATPEAGGDARIARAEGPDAADAAAAPPGDALPSYAATRAVNLRAEPTTAARVLTVVEADDVVQLLDRDGRGWLRVRYATGPSAAREVTGWVYGEYLRELSPRDGALAALQPRA